MKLIYAIVERDNVERVTDALNSKGYQATVISSTGGFLKKGNSTLMICTEDVPYNAMAQGMQHAPVWVGGIRQTIEVGGAVIMAVDACYYEKI